MRSLVKSWMEGHATPVEPKLRYEPQLVRLPRHLIDSFEHSHCDEETSAFIQSAGEYSTWKLYAADLMSSIVSRTTANGLVGRGGMFVCSTSQARQLLRRRDTTDDSPLRYGTLLDIGAGDGGVTAKLAPFFDTIYATESSPSMRWRLKQRGYVVMDTENPFADVRTGTSRTFDAIACLNVLDRADRPFSLLQSMRASLKPDGLLMLAVVLPWCPFVEVGNQQRRPTEWLNMEGGECCKGANFEASLTKLVENVLLPCGFDLVRWTRLPYLCEGNPKMRYAMLDDAVLILQRRELILDTTAAPQP